MKILKTIFRALSSACVLSLVIHAASAAADTLDDARKSGTLRVGVGLMGTKPYVWQDENGKYQGFENEILQGVIKRIGVKNYEYVVTDWSTLIPGLKSNRWDVVMTGMVKTEERIEGGGIAMSQPYFFVYDRIIVPKGSPIKSEQDLKGKTVASMLGTTDSLVAHSLVDRGVAGDVKDFNTYTEPFLALKNKQVDAVILDQVTFAGQQAQMPDLIVVGAPLPYIPKPEWAAKQASAPYKLGGVGIGVRKEDVKLLEAVNKALDEMDADGSRKAILEKYKIWDSLQTKDAMKK